MAVQTMKPLIRIFKDANFKGTNKEFQTSIPDLSRYDFNNRVSSMHVTCGTWEAFDKPNYEGSVYHLAPGQYATWKEWLGQNDNISSIRLVSSVTLYKHVNFQGNALQLVGDVPDLKALGFDNMISSAIVNGGEWRGYENPNYLGAEYNLKRGWYPTWTNWGGGNDQMSSIKRMNKGA